MGPRKRKARTDVRAQEITGPSERPARRKDPTTRGKHMRTLRQSASGRRLWRRSRTLFVASLILAVAVIGSIAAVALGSTNDPGAWTWKPTPPSSASAPLSGPAGTVLTGPSGSHVVVGQSSRNDTSAPLRTEATPVAAPTSQHMIPVLPLPKSTTTDRTAGPSVG